MSKEGQKVPTVLI